MVGLAKVLGRRKSPGAARCYSARNARGRQLCHGNRSWRRAIERSPSNRSDGSHRNIGIYDLIDNVIPRPLNKGGDFVIEFIVPSVQIVAHT